MASMSRKRIARYVATQLASNPKSNKSLVNQVAAYLVQEGRANDVRYLANDIAAELAAKGSLVLARVTTARPLTGNERDDVIEFIKKKLSVGSVELDEHVDPTLIGGIIIETPDARYDRSLKRGIEQLTSV